MKTAEEIFVDTFIERSPADLKKEDFASRGMREIMDAISESHKKFAAQEVAKEVEAYKERLKEKCSEFILLPGATDVDRHAVMIINAIIDTTK